MSIEDVSRAIMYPAIATLSFIIVASLQVLSNILLKGLPSRAWIVFFQMLFPVFLLSFLGLLAYPSHLIDEGDLKMREIVVNSDDRENASVLACLFLDGDHIGLRFFGVLFDKKMLTFWSRVIY